MSMVFILLLSALGVLSVSSEYVGPEGYILHTHSNRYLRATTADCPNNGDVVRFGSTTPQDNMLFRFVQAEGQWGYFEHACGGLFIAPKDAARGASLLDNRELEMTNRQHSGTTFYLDEDRRRIIHRTGKGFYPTNGNIWPNEGDAVRVNSGYAEESSFIFVPKDSSKTSAYPDPVLGGQWEIALAVLTPIGNHNLQTRYKVGKSMMRERSETVSWQATSEMALGWFSTSAKYSAMAQATSRETWNAEGSFQIRTNIPVSPGKSVVLWQYVFTATRLDETFRFKSNMFAETDSLFTKPAEEPPTQI